MENVKELVAEGTTNLVEGGAVEAVAKPSLLGKVGKGALVLTVVTLGGYAVVKGVKKLRSKKKAKTAELEAPTEDNE